jgi:integrase
MSVRRRKINGRWMYQARVAYQKRRASTIRATREAARAAEGDLLAALKGEARAAATAATTPATLAAVLDGYVENLRLRGKSPETLAAVGSTKAALARTCPDLLDKPVSLVEVADLYRFRMARERAGCQASTVNRNVSSLRTAIKAVRPDFKMPSDLLRKEPERVRMLEPDEELLLDTMPAPYRDMAKLAALTLMRLSEIRTLRREQVRLGEGVVVLTRTKTEPRLVVLSTAAQEVLRAALARSPSAWAFPNADGRPLHRASVSRVFKRAARAAGLTDFHFHDLRHHGAMRALNAGLSQSVVMALGGWQSERMLRRYAKVTDRVLRAAAEVVSGRAITPHQVATERATAAWAPTGREA